MAQKVFLGIRQVTKAEFEKVTSLAGYIWFVRDGEDGDVYFGSKHYGHFGKDDEEKLAKVIADVAELSGVTADIKEELEAAIEKVDGKVDELSASTVAELEKVNTDIVDIATSVAELNETVSGHTIKLDTIEEGAQVNKLEGVKVNGTEVEIVDKKAIIEIPQAAEYELLATSASTGSVAKSYALFKDGEKVGDTIDIAKDMFVNSGGVITIEDKKYVRLYLANSAGTYVDIAVADLAHVYTEGEAIEISDTDVISVELAKEQGEHVTVTTVDGLKVEVDLSDYATSADTVAAIKVVDDKIDTLEETLTDEIAKVADNLDVLSGTVKELSEKTVHADEVLLSKDLPGTVVSAKTGDDVQGVLQNIFQALDKGCLAGISSEDKTITVTALEEGKVDIKLNREVATEETIAAGHIEILEASGATYGVMYYDGDDAE